MAETGEKEITRYQDPHLHIERDNLTGSRHVIDQYHQLHPTCQEIFFFYSCFSYENIESISLSLLTFPFVRLISMENFSGTTLLVEEEA